MKRYILFSFIIIFLINIDYLDAKQTPKDTTEFKKKYPKAKITEAKKIGEAGIKAWHKKHKKAIEEAKKRKMLIRSEDKNGKVIELQNFKNGQPVYYETNNIIAAQTISTDKVWSAPYNLNGWGITLGIWDGGHVLDMHQELIARVTLQDTTTGVSKHATHVAGTMVAQGYNSDAKGMAYSANLDSYKWDADLYEMYMPSGIQISNHSYSKTTGWKYMKHQNGNYYWHWFGDTTINDFEDYKFGFYSEESDSLDDLVSLYYPNRLVIVAAANERGTGGAGPAQGESHFVWDKTINNWVTSDTTRSRDGGNLGFDCIPGGFGTAKNSITVGAVADIETGYQGNVQMTSFSSYGPTDDGRIKPDIVANGTGLFSCTNLSNSSYDTLSGTSQAAPNVSGSIALVLQKWQDDISSEAPLASTIKGLVIHTADEAGDYDGPDYRFGWGLMNTKRALDVLNLEIQDSTGSHIREEAYIGTTEEIPITYAGNDTLVITLCWSDPGHDSPQPGLNPETKMLVNDLDMELISSSLTVTKPFVLDPLNPDNPPSQGDNDRDNVEKIVLFPTTAGEYTLKIFHDPAGQSFTQDYSVIITGGIMEAPDTTIINPPPDYDLVTINQWLDDSTSQVGKVSMWEPPWRYWRNPHSVPAHYYVRESLSYLFLRADSALYSNQKFNRWNSYYSSRIWEKFYVHGNITANSWFTPISAVNFETFLNSSEESVSGEMSLKDPWYIDYNDSLYFYEDYTTKAYGFRNLLTDAPFDTFITPFVLDTTSKFSGVFLNQIPDPYDPKKQFYSTKISRNISHSYHNQNIDFYFENWDGDPDHVSFQNPTKDSTAVVFKQENAVVKARYKGHMVSNELAATSHNGGRHLLIDPIVGNGILKHAVYEDNGKIYYTSYRNDTNPEGWKKEVCLSGIRNAFVCSNPSISHYKIGTNERTIIGVVWEEDYGLGDTRDVVCRILDTGSSPLTWGNSFSISSTTVIPLQPVITPITIVPYNPEFCVMYVESDDYTSRLRFARCLPNQGEYYFSELAENLYEVEGNVLCHPTMTSKVHESKIYFAWEEFMQFSQGEDTTLPSKVHYSLLDINEPSSVDLIWTSPGIGIDSKPSIAYQMGNTLDLSWQHYDEENGTGLRHQELLMQETQSEAIVHQVCYAKRHLFSPSLSYFGWDDLTATVQETNNFLQLFYDGTDWELADDVYQGRGASLCEVDFNINTLYTKHNDGLPYLITNELLPEQVDQRTGESEILSEVVFREQSFDLEKLNNKKLSGNVSLEIGDMRITGTNGAQKIPFTAFADTLISSKFQCSQPILVTSEMQKLFFKYKVRLTGFPISNSVPNLPLFRIKLRKLNGQNLKNIMSLQLKEITSSQFYICDSVEVNLQNLVGKEIYLELKSIDHILNSKGLQKIRIHKKIYKNLNELEDRSGKSILANNHSENHIPKKFGLYQNYPNPFNPTTTIKFDLPQTSPVKLVIYNLNGQVVKTLVSGQKPAGAHKVTWQGKDDNGVQVASGIYIIQLTAGKHQFSKKLMLLK